MAGELGSRIADALFVVTHPVLAARAKSRQIAVAIEHQMPPAGVDIETFPELSLANAARAVKAAETKEESGIPKNAWSLADQKRMAQGQKPLGHPEHPNV